MSNVLFKNFKLVSGDFKTQQAKSAMLVHEGRIASIGAQTNVLKSIKAGKVKVKKEVDLKNKLVFPSFIECHTHSVFAGSRAEEFELRNTGVSYLMNF
jgi:imidazolonepropionase